MYDQLPTRIKPLWWEGLAGVGYALVTFSASAVIFNFARSDGTALWRWVLFVGIIAAFLVGAVHFVKWVGLRRRAVREELGGDTPPPSP